MSLLSVFTKGSFLTGLKESESLKLKSYPEFKPMVLNMQSSTWSYNDAH